MSQTQQSDQRKVQPTPNNTQSQTAKHISSSEERSGERISERKETSQKLLISNTKRSSKQKQDKTKPVEAAVTFAEHIRVNEADDLGQRYTFGFFEEQKQLNNLVKKSGKLTLRNHEESMSDNTTTINTATNNNHNGKTSQLGQKHRSKHHKASLNSEHKRYQFNDNIDANSFNYHQILEFISNCKYISSLFRSSDRCL